MGDGEDQGRTSPVGWLAWAAWSSGALFYCYAYFQRVAPSVMVSDLMREFSVSGAVLGNLTAFYFYAYAIPQIPLGIAIDRFGPRRPLVFAALACAAGSALLGTAHTIGIAYLGRALIGFGSGFAWIGTLQIIGQKFPARRFALLTGLTLLAGMAGGIGGQAPLSLAVATAGWRATMLGAMVAAVVLAGLIWWFVRDRGPAGAAGGTAAREFGILRGLGMVLGTRQSWTCGAYGAGLAVPVLAFAGLWGVPYMMAAYGLSRPAAALTTTLMLVGWAIGAPASGWISDHIGSRRRPMVTASVLALVSIAAALYVPGLPLLAVQALLLAHGVFAGAMVLCFVTGREHNRPAVGATAVAFVNMAVMGTSALFQPLIGWLLDLGWDGRMEAGVRVYAVEDYKRALTTLLAAGAIACAAAALTGETRCRPMLNNDGERA